jgi:DNA-binding NtrC family response regulator
VRPGQRGEGRLRLRHAALAELADELSRARTFEEAAAPCLSALLWAAAEALEGSRFSGEARILRGIVHLRPGEGYRGLVVLDLGAERVFHAQGDEFVISTAAWRTISKRDCAVAIDVETATLLPVEDDLRPARAHALPRQDASPQTVVRLQRRGATHVYVLPMRGIGGLPVGMISIEAECPKAAGQRFVWEEIHPAARLIVDFAAPYLAQLPLAAAEAPPGDPHLPVVGAAMAPLVRLLGVFARQEETLLLTGVTGTGKSRLARWCHHQSTRREGPFEIVDLLAVPEEMQMGELFGWRRGAFTGATEDHPGFVTRAEGGTLFIDEVDKLSPRAQAGLLYLLEERRYRALGDGRDRESHVRFIVGTNADLERAVQEGRFREDLYYRINVLGVTLPPLDERRDEIAPWARFMLRRRHAESGEPGAVHLDDAGALLLAEAPWPGNLRQLDNVVRRAHVLALADRDAAGDLRVEESHVRASLLAEGTPGTSLRTDPLRAAAARFVAEAARRSGGLDLDLLDGLRGLALAEAIRQTGSKEAAFRLLGRESLVRARNHHKALQRELARAADLSRALGLPVAKEEET